MGESKILGHRLIEDAERVRKQHTAVEGQRRALPAPPCCAGKVAKTVDRDDNSLVEGRGKECRGEMSQVVFDVFDFSGKWPARQCAELIGDTGHLLPIAQPLEQQAHIGPMQRHVAELAHQIGAAVAVDRDVRHVGQFNLGFAQAVVDRL